MADDPNRLATISLDNAAFAGRGAAIDSERDAAIADLIQGNRFVYQGGDGPYGLTLRLREMRLILEVRDGSDTPLGETRLNLTPFRQVIRDYFTVCDSYYAALRTFNRSRVEAIDVGRRSLHDEAATALQARLAPQIEVDLPTARRLFTLICALYPRG